MHLRALPTCLLLAAAAPAAAETFYACDTIINSVPVTISTQGVYCLTHDVSTALASGAAITIAANNVTLDCNGYKIGGLAAGVATDAYGIHATNRLNTTVRRCSIRGFRLGIAFDGSGASGGVVEDNRLDQSRAAGIYVTGEGHSIRRNFISGTGGDVDSSPAGIRGAGSLHDISDNDIDHVFASSASGFAASVTGIALGTGKGNVVRGNRIQRLLRAGSGNAHGIDAAGEQASIEGNSLALDNDAAIVGYGIWGDIKTACRDNLVSGWNTPLQGCAVSLDNVVDPPP